MSTTEESSEATRGISRRRAVKVGAAVAVGAAVWTEPTIKGLAKRPAYAAADSSAVPTFHDLVAPASVAIVSDITVTTTTDGVVTLTLTRVDDGEGIFYTFTAALEDCICVWSDTATVTISAAGGFPSTGATNGLDPSIIRFEWPGLDDPDTLTVSDTITVECSPI